MTPLREGPRITTRLAPDDHSRFLRVLSVQQMTYSQLARDAICFYLDALEADAINRRDSKVEARIKKMEDRLAGLVARANIDIGVVINLMYARMNSQTREEEITVAHQKSAQRLRKKLDTIEDFKVRFQQE